MEGLDIPHLAYQSYHHIILGHGPVARSCGFLVCPRTVATICCSASELAYTCYGGEQLCNCSAQQGAFRSFVDFAVLHYVSALWTSRVDILRLE